MGDGDAATYPLVIWTPSALRVYSVVFGIGWCSMLVWYTARNHPFGGLAPILPLLIAGVALAIRMFLVAIVLRDTQMVVRNVVSTEVVERSAVRGFVVETHDFAFSRDIVHVVLTDGSTRQLQALSWHSVFARNRQKLEAIAATLEAWRSTARESESA